MQRYQCKNGHTGVIAFQLGKEHIDIEFRDGDTYRYSFTKPGKAAVTEMKRLAIKGKGLSTYINKYVRQNYAQKLK